MCEGVRIKRRTEVGGGGGVEGISGRDLRDTRIETSNELESNERNVQRGGGGEMRKALIMSYVHMYAISTTNPSSTGGDMSSY